MVEGAEDRDLFGFRGPHGKVGALDALHGRGVCPEFLIEVEVRTFVKEVQVVCRKQTGLLRREPVWLRCRFELLVRVVIQNGIHRCRVLCAGARRQSAGRVFLRWSIRCGRRMARNDPA